MKDMMPTNQRTIAIVALFGILSALVAWFLFNFGFLGGLSIGLLVAVIVAIAMALAAQEPAEGAVRQAAAAAATPTASSDPAPAPAQKAEAAPAVASDADKPTFLDAARADGPDDLKLIKGVGPKLEKTLHGMGIYHFDQIAAWGPKEQGWVDDNLEGFKGRASRDKWVEQARTLAAGGETAVSNKAK